MSAPPTHVHDIHMPAPQPRWLTLVVTAPHGTMLWQQQFSAEQILGAFRGLCDSVDKVVDDAEKLPHLLRTAKSLWEPEGTFEGGDRYLRTCDDRTPEQKYCHARRVDHFVGGGVSQTFPACNNFVTETGSHGCLFQRTIGTWSLAEARRMAISHAMCEALLNATVAVGGNGARGAEKLLKYLHDNDYTLVVVCTPHRWTKDGITDPLHITVRFRKADGTLVSGAWHLYLASHEDGAPVPAPMDDVEAVRGFRRYVIDRISDHNRETYE